MYFFIGNVTKLNARDTNTLAVHIEILLVLHRPKTVLTNVKDILIVGPLGKKHAFKKYILNFLKILADYTTIVQFQKILVRKVM